MKTTKTKREMLSYLRTLMRLEPQRSDCTIEYTDGIDTDALLEDRLRQWYLDILRNADRSYIAEEDVAASCGVRPGDAPAGGTVIELPERAVRVFEVRLSGWTSAAEVFPANVLRSIIRRQGNMFMAATADAPVAVMNGDGRTVFAYPSSGQVESVKCAADTGPSCYVLDESALSLLDNIKI